MNSLSCSLIRPIFTSYVADFENQGAHDLVKEFDPEGKRTVCKPLELRESD